MSELITMPRAVLEQSLEALVWEAGSEPALYSAQTLSAITALRAALAQQAEPVRAEDEISRSERILKMVDTYCARPDSMNRTALMVAVEGEFEDARPSCEDLGYVPLSEDGRSVFIDGVGLVPLAQAEPVQAVSGVVIREGLPTLLRDRDIQTTDTRLYTTPQQRKPLTDDEIEALFKGVDSEDKGRFAIVRGFARAIEAAHGIKEAK